MKQNRAKPDRRFANLIILHIAVSRIFYVTSLLAVADNRATCLSLSRALFVYESRSNTKILAGKAYTCRQVIANIDCSERMGDPRGEYFDHGSAVK